ncbi:MAG: hypothetical protein RIK87_28960 [Fuerstiella sp.]
MKRFSHTLLITQLAAGLMTVGSPTFAAEPSSVAYRLKEVKTIHFDDPGKAQLHLDAVRRLGCEARMDDHGGHLDVSCRLTQWKALTLADEDTAHRWNAWLTKAGFETIHAHGENHDHTGHDHSGHDHSTGTGLQGGHQHGVADGHSHSDRRDHGPASVEILTYLLPDWTTTHSRNQREADELRAILKGLGCDVRSEPHDGHEDIVFRCPRPMHLELPSHQVASNWEDWMKRTGFRTQHSH